MCEINGLNLFFNNLIKFHSLKRYFIIRVGFGSQVRRVLDLLLAAADTQHGGERPHHGPATLHVVPLQVRFL